jgi:alkaline phosphatase D
MGFTEKQNYGRISVNGTQGQRQLTVDFVGVRGEPLGRWSVTEAEVKTPLQNLRN